jgi:hypothetical protein
MKIKLDPIQTILALALKFYGGHDYLNYVVIQYGGMGAWLMDWKCTTFCYDSC